MIYIGECNSRTFLPLRESLILKHSPFLRETEKKPLGIFSVGVKITASFQDSYHALHL